MWSWFKLHMKLMLVLNVKRKNTLPFVLLSHNRHSLNWKLLAILPSKHYEYEPWKLIWYQLNLNTQLSPLDSGEIIQYKDCHSMPPNSIKEISEGKTSPAFNTMYHLHLLIHEIRSASVNEWHRLLGLDAVTYGCYILFQRQESFLVWWRWDT